VSLLPQHLDQATNVVCGQDSFNDKVSRMNITHNINLICDYKLGLKHFSIQANCGHKNETVTGAQRKLCIQELLNL
jgi:hypothetical protein